MNCEIALMSMMLFLIAMNSSIMGSGNRMQRPARLRITTSDKQQGDNIRTFSPIPQMVNPTSLLHSWQRARVDQALRYHDCVQELVNEKAAIHSYVRQILAIMRPEAIQKMKIPRYSITDMHAVRIAKLIIQKKQAREQAHGSSSHSSGQLEDVDTLIGDCLKRFIVPVSAHAAHHPQHSVVKNIDDARQHEPAQEALSVQEHIQHGNATCTSNCCSIQ